MSGRIRLILEPKHARTAHRLTAQSHRRDVHRTSALAAEKTTGAQTQRSENTSSNRRFGGAYVLALS
jgi:hypothetical protein